MTIYFCENTSADEIKIGYTDGSPDRRLGQHKEYGFDTILALIPGQHDDEQAILKYFSEHLIRGKEWFSPADEIYEYLFLLKANKYAVDCVDDFPTLPALPYVVWGPGNIKQTSNNVGQLDIFGDGATPRDRVVYFSNLAHLSSMTDEWYTPQSVITLARDVMGDIDLDPATGVLVNSKWIKAKAFYDRLRNGLMPEHMWFGRVWLNPPYGKGENSAANFITRLVNEFSDGNVTEAITCLNLNSSCAMWFDKVWATAAMHCIWRGRIDFVAPDGESDSSPSKGTILSYFGPNTEKFAEVFNPHGTIVRVIK